MPDALRGVLGPGFSFLLAAALVLLLGSRTIAWLAVIVAPR